MQANHGGGYSYRLCPLGAAALDEECFNRWRSRWWAGRRCDGGRGRAHAPLRCGDGARGDQGGRHVAQEPVPRPQDRRTGAWGKGSNHPQTGWGFEPVCEDDLTLALALTLTLSP